MKRNALKLIAAEYVCTCNYGIWMIQLEQSFNSKENELVENYSIFPLI